MDQGDGSGSGDSSLDILSPYSVPVSPLAPPSFTAVVPTQVTDPTGTYRISYSQAQPNDDINFSDSSMLPISAVLLRVTDRNASTNSYYWQVSMSTTVIMTSFWCLKYVLLELIGSGVIRENILKI